MIFVFDLDGTICFKGQIIDEEICHALEECVAQRHEVIFASARPIRDMLPVIPSELHSFKMVGGNGAFTFYNKELQVVSFTEETLNIILELIKQHQLTYLIDSDWDYSFTGAVTHPIYQNVDPEKRAMNKSLKELTQISKIVLFDVEQGITDQILSLPVTVFQHHNESLIDISPQGIHKMQGLLKLGVQSGEFIAFGNDQNDIELFQHAKYSVCVGVHEAGKHADQIIEQATVAETIKELARLHAEQLETKL